MILSIITADIINISHKIGVGIIGVTPVLPFLVEVATRRKKKHKRRIYIGLGIINFGVLLTYYFNNDVCILSKCENYFNPIKYEIYQVGLETKNNLYVSCICLGIQAISNKFEQRAVAVGSYYAHLIYSFFAHN